MADRPTGRQKHITEGGSGVHKRGEGLGTGPVGSGSNFHGSSSGNSGNSSPSPSRGVVRGGGISMGTIVLILIVFFVIRSLGGSDDTDDTYYQEPAASAEQTQTAETGSGSDMGSLFSALFGGGGGYSSSTDYGGWKDTSYRTGQLDETVAEGARAKRTVIKADGTDDNVILVYMCGTDLESRNGMASRDLAEMAQASLNDHVRIYVYTGGCKNWQTKSISSRVNQIYEVTGGGLKLLESDMGSGSPVDPSTLVSFLKWARTNTKGNRYDLIFWDHGGGSVSGFGYDEKNPRAGSMDLAGIGRALKEGGITYDFVGFDACLMATVETALVVGNYADYLIASEETEPGVGWYYTTWLTDLARDPGMPTINIGKTIVDTFTGVCERDAAGQKTTLSVIDLAELALTVPESLRDFAASTSKMIKEDAYQTVSDARSGAREFAGSSRIDQVDLVHLAMNIGTPEGDALAKALKGAVKYNRTSSSMTNSYGLSIYFPMKRASSVDSMVSTYEAIGMDADYTRMIQEAASMNVYGQAAAGGTGSPLDSLFGDASDGTDGGADAITQLLTALLEGDRSVVSGLTTANTAFLGRGVPVETAASYIADHHFPAEDLEWQDNADGDPVISLDEEAWSSVHELVLNMFYDDGEGFVDLGIDNVYEFDDDGNLLAPADRTWVSIEGQPVAYYYVDQSDGVITGYVPAFLNGDRVNLLIRFDDAHPYGLVAGASYDYQDTGIDVIAKNLTVLEPGDRLEFVCDYYTYNGDYQDSYLLGEPLTVTGAMEDLKISNTDVGEGRVRMLYRFTDLYSRDYWTPAIEG